MGKYLIRNEGCDDTTETEMDLSEYEYRVLEKFAVENNKNSHCGCQPRIEIYSNYKKEENIIKKLLTIMEMNGKIYM